MRRCIGGGQFNGPVVRKWLGELKGILVYMKAELIKSGREELEAAKFVATHFTPMKFFDRICRLMRAPRMLSQSEINELTIICAAYGTAFRSSFPGKFMTVKSHMVEFLVPKIARRFGSVGLFGQDGAESKHCDWTNAAIRCRSLKNAEARILATKRLCEGKQRCNKTEMEKKSRQSKK